VRGVLQGLGHAGKVKSPTYTLVEPYTISKKNIYHFDLYRFIDEEEWEAAGFREYFNANTICFVEWSEKAKNLLPQADIDIYLSPNPLNGRQLRFSANTQQAAALLSGLQH
jgi:tRNA threonylcarbamoyladenosine biosynthesis protein TsaE